MELKVLPRVKRKLLQFGQPVLTVIVGRAMYDYLVTPAIPFLPNVVLFVYSILMTVFAVLFLVGLLAAIWSFFATGWQYFTSRKARDVLRERIHRWPTNKWDTLPAIGVVYVVATMVPMVTILLVLPQGRLVGVVSQEELANILLVVFTPIVLIFSAMMLQLAFEAYRDMKQRWTTGTRTERFTYAGVAAFVVVAWVFMMAGEIAGWDEMIWMNSS